MPNDSTRKVYIIDGADQMNVRAQNTLLKVLEEPPAFVSFILLAENSGALLETIRSRCIDVKMQTEEDEIGESAAANGASQLFDALDSGTDLEICRLLLEMEKLDRNVFPEFIAGGYTEAVKRIKNSALEGRNPQIYAEAAQIFKECRKYTEYNVSNGHICGMLAALLIELRTKK